MHLNANLQMCKKLHKNRIKTYKFINLLPLWSSSLNTMLTLIGKFQHKNFIRLYGSYGKWNGSLKKKRVKIDWKENLQSMKFLFSCLHKSLHYFSSNDDLFTHFYTFAVAFKWIFSIIMMLQEHHGRLIFFLL